MHSYSLWKLFHDGDISLYFFIVSYVLLFEVFTFFPHFLMPFFPMPNFHNYSPKTTNLELQLFFSLGPQSLFWLCFLIFFLIFACLSIPSFWFFCVLLLFHLSLHICYLIFSQMLSGLKSPSYPYCTPYPLLLLQSKPFSFI